MSPIRRDALLSGQHMNARRVYNSMAPGEDMNVAEIASALTKATDLKMGIHDLRGCISSLTGAGLLREIVPGVWRRESVKPPKPESIKEPQKEQVAVSQTNPVKKHIEPIDVLAAVAATLRAAANEIETAALALEERRQAVSEEAAKLNQLKALLKDL